MPTRHAFRPVALAVIAATAVLLPTGCSVFRGHDNSAAIHDGVVADKDTGVRLITSGAEGMKVTFGRDDPPPMSPNLDFAEPLGDPVDITPAGTLPATEVRMRGEAGGFIAVYNTTAGAWLPLDTQYDEATHEMVAQAPHFSFYRGFGSVLTGPGTSSAYRKINDKLAAQAVKVLVKMRDDLVGNMRPEDMADCGGGRTADGKDLPDAAKSTAVAAPGWGSRVKEGHAKELGVCVADDQGARWLRVTNKNGYPVVLYPPDGVVDASPNDYDTRMLNDDLFLLLGRQLEAVAGHGLVGGLKSGELKITGDTSFTVNVMASPLPIAYDVATALLSIVLPAVPEAKLTLNAAKRRVFEARGGPAGGVDAVVQEIKDDSSMREVNPRAGQAMALLDMWSCLAKSQAAAQNVSITDMWEAVRDCVGLAAATVGREAAALGTDLLKNLKVFNEVKDFVRHARTPAVIGVDAPQRESRLGGVDWLATAGANLGCSSNPVLSDVPVDHDVTGDKVPDTFVTLTCDTSNEIYPDHIEVYDGASDPAAPALLGVLTDEAGTNFHLKCLTFDRRNVTTRGFVLRGDDPAGAPSLLGKRTATWGGTSFRLAPMTTSDAPAGYESSVPGCG